jgi:hypothetical protein
MEEQRQKDFDEYLSGLRAAQKKEFAARCGTTYNYLIQVANGHRRASSRLARKFYEASGRVVRLASIRSDIWAEEVGDNKAQRSSSRLRQEKQICR